MKRADIATMLLVTYTSLADDERAKLLLYPLLSGLQLALCARCRPYSNEQARPTPQTLSSEP